MSLLSNNQEQQHRNDQQEFIAGYGDTVERATQAAEQVVLQVEPAIIQELNESYRRQNAGRMATASQLMPAQAAPAVAEVPTTAARVDDGVLNVERIRQSVAEASTSSATGNAAAFPLEVVAQQKYQDDYELTA